MLIGWDNINGQVSGTNASGSIGASASLGGVQLGLSISYSYVFVDGMIHLRVEYVTGAGGHVSYYNTGAPASTVLKNLSIPGGFSPNITFGNHNGSAGRWVNFDVPYTTSSWDGVTYTLHAGTQTVWYFVPIGGGGKIINTINSLPFQPSLIG